MSSQKYRISLSQATALQAPLTTSEQIAEARTRAREDLNEALNGAEKAFKTLIAPPSAVKSLSKRRLAEMRNVAQAEQERIRQAKPPAKMEKTSAAPTPERMSKEPAASSWEKPGQALAPALHAGGQISHATRVWLDEYGHRVPQRIEPSIQLLLDAWDIANRVRTVSSRAYTGAPYTGAGPDHEGHVPMSARDRRDMEHFAYAMEHLTAQTNEWWNYLRLHILRDMDSATGRIPTMHEVGTAIAGYAPKSDNARSAGVTTMILALLRWQEAVQAGAMKLQYAKMRRQALHEQAATRWVDERRVRMSVQRKQIEKDKGTL